MQHQPPSLPPRVFQALMDLTTFNEDSSLQAWEMDLDEIWVQMSTHPNPQVRQAWAEGEPISQWQYLTWLLMWWIQAPRLPHVTPPPWTSPDSTWSPEPSPWPVEAIPSPPWLQQLSLELKTLGEQYTSDPDLIFDQGAWESINQTYPTQTMSRDETQEFWSTWMEEHEDLNPNLNKLLGLLMKVDPPWENEEGTTSRLFPRYPALMEWTELAPAHPLSPKAVSEAYLTLVRTSEQMVNDRLLEELIQITYRDEPTWDFQEDPQGPPQPQITLVELESLLRASDDPLISFAMDNSWPVNLHTQIGWLVAWWIWDLNPKGLASPSWIERGTPTQLQAPWWIVEQTQVPRPLWLTQWVEQHTMMSA